MNCLSFAQPILFHLKWHLELSTFKSCTSCYKNNSTLLPYWVRDKFVGNVNYSWTALSQCLFCKDIYPGWLELLLLVKTQSLHKLLSNKESSVCTHSSPLPAPCHSGFPRLQNLVMALYLSLQVLSMFKVHESAFNANHNRRGTPFHSESLPMLPLQWFKCSKYYKSTIIAHFNKDKQKYSEQLLALEADAIDSRLPIFTASAPVF